MSRSRAATTIRHTCPATSASSRPCLQADGRATRASSRGCSSISDVARRGHPPTRAGVSSKGSEALMRLLQDLRFAVRTLRRSHFVTTIAIVALALGIGVTTAVFSIFNSVLLRPLPFPDPAEIVSVYDTQPACATCPASYPKYIDWKTRNTVFAAIGGSTQASFTLTGAGDPVRVAGIATTSTLVDVLGVPPALGRWFTEREDQFGGPRVVVLGYDFWKRQYGGDAGIVGKRILFDGNPVEVIGVMPEGFAHRRGQFFVPLQRKLDPSTRGSHFLATYARLKKGVSLERATAEMRTLGTVLAREFGHN